MLSNGKKTAAIFSVVVLLASGTAFADQTSGSVASSRHYDENIVITATSDDVEGSGRLYGIGSNSHEGVNITADPGVTITVNAEQAGSNNRAYAVVNYADSSIIRIDGDTMTFNAVGSAGAQARAIRNNCAGTSSLIGNTINISAHASDSLATVIDAWNGGTINIDASVISADAYTTNGGRALAVCVDNSVVNLDGTQANISAIAEHISDSTWTNALVTEAGGKVKFNSKETSLRAIVKDENNSYTAQAISMNSTDDVIEFNGDKVLIYAGGAFGANSIGHSVIPSKLYFNSGDVDIRAEITGDGAGERNAIGILGGLITVGENVNNFNITVSGSGVDNGNSNFANGTAACYLSSQDSMSVAAKSFNINVTGGASGVDYRSDSYGLRISGGQFMSSPNTAVEVSVKDDVSSALGLSVKGDASVVEMQGDVNITAVGTEINSSLGDGAVSGLLNSHSLAVAATDGGRVALGSAGSSVVVSGDVVAAASSDIAICGSKVEITAEKIGADNSNLNISAGPGSSIHTAAASAENGGAVVLTLTGDWTGQPSYTVFKSNTPVVGNFTVDTASAKGLAGAEFDPETGELVVEPQPGVEPGSSSGGGCSAGWSALSLLVLAPLAASKKK